MDENQPPPPRNSSRTLVKAAVALLVVIAIAGIVLAWQRKGTTPADAPDAADATRAASAPMTAGLPSSAPAPAPSGPNDVVFAADSDQLPAVAAAKLARVAEVALKRKLAMVISATVEARPDQAGRMDLAQRRALAVRSVLEANKVSASVVQVRVDVKPLGLLSASDADRVDVACAPPGSGKPVPCIKLP